MAITALATSNTTIGPAQFADMQEILRARFMVDSPTDLKPSVGSNNSVNVSAGAGFAGGSRLRSTGAESVTCDGQSAGSRWDAICIRIDWSTSTQQLIAIKGTATTIPINRSNSPNKSQVNRIPGVLYDAMICYVKVSAGSSTVSSLTDMRMWGGDGGPYRTSPEGLGSANLMDARPGTLLTVDRGTSTKRLDDDGTWRDIGTASNPWKTWTPTLRFYGSNTVTGTSGGTVAGLGNGGQSSGRYRVVDGMLDGYVYIQPGATGATFGDGPMTIDLPLTCANWQNDTWSMGHLYTFGYGGDGAFDWHMECLIKANWNRGMLWTNRRIEDARLYPYVCQRPNGGPGTGTPYINGGYPVGAITMHINYPVE